MDSDSGKRLHGCITDRTIPLDEFCRQEDNANKSKCGFAALCCILDAALHGSCLSDCHFFNLGVQLTGNATDHLVVIIDVNRFQELEIDFFGPEQSL